MKIGQKKSLSKNLAIFALATVVLSLTFTISCPSVAAHPDSTYYYKFIVDAEGSANVEINFSSTDVSGLSWLVVPKFFSWNYTITNGSIVHSENVSTVDVGLEDFYFYQVFNFSYQSTSSFTMTVRFDFDNAALIVEPRGIFFSSLIGYLRNGATSGQAEVLFDSHFTVNQQNAIAIGTYAYSPSESSSNRVLFNIPSNEDVLRLQVEFTSTLALQSKTLNSANGVFTFDTPNRYEEYAKNILNLYDTLYNGYVDEFNVTLDNIGVQFFIPEFEEFQTLGGYVPFSETGAGEINLNVFFIRAVNGTMEVIAAHELVHHFMYKSGISPNSFLWFHEGLAQYGSVVSVGNLGYEGADYESERLENGSSQLISLLGGENFGFLQDWNPYQSPANVGNYYYGSYYVVSRLAQDYGGLEYYKRFFALIQGISIDDIDILALYLSKAANTSVASTLQDWGFKVIDLYAYPEISEKIIETQKAIAAVNPIFQLYKSLADFFYRLALNSFRQGDINGGESWLQLAISTANSAPMLTLLTVAVLLAIVGYVLYRHNKKAKLKAAMPTAPPTLP